MRFIRLIMWVVTIILLLGVFGAFQEMKAEYEAMNRHCAVKEYLVKFIKKECN